jgi:hypothetical protein
MATRSGTAVATSRNRSAAEVQRGGMTSSGSSDPAW